MVKNLSSYAADTGSIPWLGRLPGEGNGNLVQYSCLKSVMDRGAWWGVHVGLKESDVIEQLSTSRSKLLIPNSSIFLSWRLLRFHREHTPHDLSALKDHNTCSALSFHLGPFIPRTRWEKDSNSSGGFLKVSETNVGLGYRHLASSQLWTRV